MIGSLFALGYRRVCPDCDGVMFHAGGNGRDARWICERCTAEMPLDGFDRGELRKIAHGASAPKENA